MIGRTIVEIRNDAVMNELHKIEGKIKNELVVEPSQIKQLKYEARRIRQSLKMEAVVY